MRGTINPPFAWILIVNMFVERTEDFSADLYCCDGMYGRNEWPVSSSWFIFVSTINRDTHMQPRSKCVMCDFSFYFPYPSEPLYIRFDMLCC